MDVDVATSERQNRRAERRRRDVVLAGHRGDGVTARRALDDPDAGVREAALGALGRIGELTVRDVTTALADRSPRVRRRAVEVASAARGRGSRSSLPGALITALGDPDPLVVTGAAWFLGERRQRSAVGPLVELAARHADTRCREAAVAALGAIGDPSGLPAVIGALQDKTTVRRRATVALAGFDDPGVEAALRVAAADRDWQVRHAAEELLGGS